MGPGEATGGTVAVMRLHRFGTGRPRVLALHGFAQQGGHFAEIAPYIGAPVLAPDLPGHGPEPHLPATMDEAVARVANLIDETGVDVVLGYSMGGRVAMRAVLGRPVGLLVLVSVSAGIRSEALRAERVAADAALADRIEDEGMSVFLDEWDRLPMFAGLAGRSDAWKEEERRLRLENDPKGVAAALRGMGQGVTVPLSDEVLSGITSPTVLLAGSEDGAYAREADRLAGVFPAGKCVVHPSGGHSLVSEDPGWVAIHVRRGL
jgi:2-succinyl-6-hydroxy-2,4-cyclohexadiene-1-carboxylate synthase